MKLSISLTLMSAATVVSALPTPLTLLKLGRRQTNSSSFAPVCTPPNGVTDKPSNCDLYASAATATSSIIPNQWIMTLQAPKGKDLNVDMHKLKIKPKLDTIVKNYTKLRLDAKKRSLLSVLLGTKSEDLKSITSKLSTSVTQALSNRNFKIGKDKGGYVLSGIQEADVDSIVKSFVSDDGTKLQAVPDMALTLASYDGQDDMSATSHQSSKRQLSNSTSKYIDQVNTAPWGIARVGKPASSSGAQPASSWSYDSVAGSDSVVYVVDSGINVNHPDFGGRAIWGNNFIDSDNTDGNGHGTHVAGIVGGAYTGMAKNSTLIAVKVLSTTGQGSMSSLLNALSWVVSDANNRTNAQGVPISSSGQGIINLSVGGSFSSYLNQAVQTVTDYGLSVVSAAGNSNANVNLYSPPSAPSVVTVAASDSSNNRAWFSNFGAAIDVFAPGVSINSTSTRGGYELRTGTSMAAPHVAGLFAYLRSRQPSLTSPQLLINYALGPAAGVIQNIGLNTPTNGLAHAIE